MQISTQQFYDRSLRNMQNTQSDAAKTNEQLSTGKALIRPSDDTDKLRTIGNLERAINKVQSYNNNVDHLINRYATEEGALTSASDILVRARELAIQASNATVSSEDRKIIAIEVDGLKSELLALANAKDVNGQAMFAGAKTSVEPFVVAADGEVSYQGDSRQTMIEVSENRQLPKNRSGLEVFTGVTRLDENGKEERINFFAVLNDFKESLLLEQKTQVKVAANELSATTGELTINGVQISQATEQAFVVKEKTTAEVPKEIELAISELAGQFDTYADLEILKDTLAQAVAAGKVELKSMDGKLVVTVKGEADDDGTSDSDETLEEGEIDSETLELYAKIADVQAEIETEVVVEHLDLDRQELARDEGYEQRINEQFEALKINLKQEVDAGLAKIEMIEKKIVIKLASQDSFDSGFATIKSSFLPTLERVRDAVSGTPERITVSGHTDNVPIMFSDRFRSNWDLSSARASAVADFMLQDPNVLQSRLRVYGFADTRPTATNDTREGRAENRRIEIEIGQ